MGGGSEGGLTLDIKGVVSVSCLSCTIKIVLGLRGTLLIGNKVDAIWIGA